MSSSQDLVLLAAGATVAAVILSAVIKPSKSASGKGYKEIPMPPGRYPYVGHLLSLGSVPCIQITKWQQEYGPIIRLQMGVQTWIMISDPKIADEIFGGENGVHTSSRPYQPFGFELNGRGGNGLVFTEYNENTRRNRKAIRSLFSPKSQRDMDEALEYEADEIIREILSRMKEKGSVHTFPLMQLSSLNVVLSACLGTRADSLEDPIFKMCYNTIDKGTKYAGVDGDIGAFLPILSFIDILAGSKKKQKRFVLEERDVLLKTLQQRSLEGGKDCFYKQMLQEPDLTKDNIDCMLSDLMAAGADTIAVALSWALLVLSHYPEIQKKLCAEIDAFVEVHHRVPTFAEREQLPYLIAFQKENLRFRSPTQFGIPHVAVEWRGCLIPKGTPLVCNMYGLHMNPDVYKDPEQFRPERYLGDLRTLSASSKTSYDKRDQYGFGWGRRLCPGIDMADREIFNMLVRLLAICTVEPEKGPNGEFLYTELNGIRNGGVVIPPLPHKLCFVERPDRKLPIETFQ